MALKISFVGNILKVEIYIITEKNIKALAGIVTVNKGIWTISCNALIIPHRLYREELKAIFNTILLRTTACITEFKLFELEESMSFISIKGMNYIVDLMITLRLYL